MWRGKLRAVENLGTFETFVVFRGIWGPQNTSRLLICDGEQVDIPRYSLTLCGRVPQTRTIGNASPRGYEE